MTLNMQKMDTRGQEKVRLPLSSSDVMPAGGILIAWDLNHPGSILVMLLRWAGISWTSMYPMSIDNCRGNPGSLTMTKCKGKPWMGSSPFEKYVELSCSHFWLICMNSICVRSLREELLHTSTWPVAESVRIFSLTVSAFSMATSIRAFWLAFNATHATSFLQEITFKWNKRAVKCR